MNAEHCETMFNAASIGIVLINKAGIIELANNKSCEMFGYDVAELVGEKLEVVLPDALREAHVAHRNNYFKKPTTRAMGSNLSLFAKNKNETVFPVEISLGHYSVEGDTKAIAFITDVSLRKEKEQELNRLKLELEDQVLERTSELTRALAREAEINDMKSRFVSMASHEFRTPLTAILSSANLATKYVEAGKSDKIKKHLERIEESSNNLVDILNDFLSLEKIEAGKEQVDCEELQVEGFLQEIISGIDDIVKPGQEVKLKCNGEADFKTDCRILRNILLNILSNAIKYSPPHSPIDVEANCSASELTIAVKDNGIGIPSDEQDKLFTKFFRAHNAENIQGTGLGLNIVKRYLSLINGTINFTSTEGKGTTFTINIKQA